MEIFIQKMKFQKCLDWFIKTGEDSLENYLQN